MHGEWSLTLPGGARLSGVWQDGARGRHLSLTLPSARGEDGGDTYEGEVREVNGVPEADSLVAAAAAAAVGARSPGKRSPGKVMKAAEVLKLVAGKPAQTSPRVVGFEPHGRGKMTYGSGDVYEGDGRGGVRSGFGTVQWANGDGYTGDWSAASRRVRARASSPTATPIAANGSTGSAGWGAARTPPPSTGTG